MVITVHLHTILQIQREGILVNKIQVELPEGSNLYELIEKLDINLPIHAMLLLINGKIAYPSSELHYGDEVNLMPTISGG